MSNTLKILCRNVNSFISSSQRQQLQPLRQMMASASNVCGGGGAIVAVAQMRATDDKVANFQQVEELVARAKAKQAQILFLPECCDYVSKYSAQLVELAEPLNGPLMCKYQELAKTNNMWLSLGGLHELKPGVDGQKDKVYNSHVLLNNKGEMAGLYHKLHLFDAQTDEINLRESATVEPGERLERPVQTPAGLLGLQVCYDLRFAEPAILLRKLGAQILSYPAAFTYSTGKAHWEVLLRARAIETQCFVIAAAQKGYNNEKRRTWGHAMVINPWGNILVDCGGDEELAIGVAEVDVSTLDKLYKSMPCFEHRRNDIYSVTPFNMSVTSQEQSKDREFATNIVDKRTIFYETEHCYAFTNLRCVVLGHVLVSTKRITPRLNGLNCAEMTDLFSTVCLVQRMLETIYGTTSATVTVQDGAQAGQTVPHVHFHVMPRRKGDFCHNDQIYVKLDDCAEHLPERTLQERIDEAQKYRAHLEACAS